MNHLAASSIADPSRRPLRRSGHVLLLGLCLLLAAGAAYADNTYRRPKVKGTVLTAAWIPEITATKFCEIEKGQAFVSYQISSKVIPPGTTVTRANLYSADDWGLTFKGYLDPTQDKYFDSITCRKKPKFREPWYLCDHPESMTAQDSQGAGIFFHRVGWQEEVWIAGVRYTHAIGMHPGVNGGDQGTSWAEFSIPAGAKFFQVSFGMARQDIHPDGYGYAAGAISIDGRQVWSGTLSGPQVIVVPAIAIPAGARTLRLAVDSLGTRWSDHTTWANPRFTTKR